MAITVEARPASLAWSDFTVLDTPNYDVNDGTSQGAVTQPNFALPDLPPRTVDGQLALADPNTITITPNARVYKAIRQTPKLLSHEQFHYDVGIIAARALARDLTSLRAGDLDSLKTAAIAAARLHFVTRARPIQSKYDVDTNHGDNQHYQKIWKDRMAKCLADPNCTEINGMPF